MPAADGLVVVDKHAGPTSHDVVNRLRRLFGTRRVGHAGTLDPPATGILLVGLGRATRILQFLQALPKTYRAAVQFGATTSTQDATGSVLEERPCAFTAADLAAAAASLTGEIQQVPPMVSAVRVGGERLYEAARRGEEVERPARSVTVYELAAGGFDPGTWRATLDVRCSSGTYVRTIAADLGEALGCGAHLAALRRTAVGSLGEADAVTVAELEALGEEERTGRVLPLSEAFRDFERLEVSGGELEDVAHGRPLGSPGAGPDGPEGSAGNADGRPVGILDPDGRLIAVYRRQGAGLKPAAVLVP